MVGTVVAERPSVLIANEPTLLVAAQYGSIPYVGIGLVMAQDIVTEPELEREPREPAHSAEVKIIDYIGEIVRIHCCQSGRRRDVIGRRGISHCPMCGNRIFEKIDEERKRDLEY